MLRHITSCGQSSCPRLSATGTPVRSKSFSTLSFLLGWRGSARSRCPLALGWEYWAPARGSLRCVPAVPADATCVCLCRVSSETPEKHSNSYPTPPRSPCRSCLTRRRSRPRRPCHPRTFRNRIHIWMRWRPVLLRRALLSNVPSPPALLAPAPFPPPLTNQP